MDGVSFTLAVLAILAIAGVSVYFYMEFDKHNISNKEDYNKLATDINNEQSNRLSNMSSIVEQVNTINNDIKKTYDEANAGQNEKITNIGVKLDNIETGFGSLISATDIDLSSNLQLSNIADFKNVDYRLLKNISVVGGMTIKDTNIKKPFKICHGEPEKCIQFPDSSGNVFLTGFNNGKILMGSETSFKNGITFLNDDVNYGTITQDNENKGILIKSANINLDGTVVFNGDIKDESGKLTKYINNFITKKYNSNNNITYGPNYVNYYGFTIPYWSLRNAESFKKMDIPDTEIDNLLEKGKEQYEIWVDYLNKIENEVKNGNSKITKEGIESLKREYNEFIIFKSLGERILLENTKLLNNIEDPVEKEEYRKKLEKQNKIPLEYFTKYLEKLSNTIQILDKLLM